MTIEPQDLARALARLLALKGPGGLTAARSPLSRAALAVLREGALAPLARRFAAAPTPEHREIAALLADSLAARDYRAALALVSTAGHRPDLRAEKILSRRYRFLWICNPKAASRSIIAALRAADPDARLIQRLTLDQVLGRHPEARDYLSFAFLRHPRERIRSFHSDKHTRARRDRNDYRWFIEPWHGVRLGMSFAEFCRWLNTPCGSDAFADRHWLSQSRQIATSEGRLPDFLGRYETLERDWRAITGRLGLPAAPLPHLNARPAPAPPEPDSDDPDSDDEVGVLLRRRYAEDFRIGGYGEPPRPTAG